jgi:DNA-binding SARP family transcriptional activator
MAEFRLLGPVELVVEGEVVPLPAGKPRALLALLLLSRNRVVPVGELIDELWGEAPPETATKALQGYVSQLRRAIGADRILTKSRGYSLRVEEGELDFDRFQQLVRDGRERLAAGEAKAASERLGEALSLWRGRPFAEFGAEPFARDAGARLEEARLSALEDRLEADLALGRHARLVSELEQLAAAEPFRERLRGQLMLALYRSGRQTEALDVYRRTRETLVEELGIEPSEELQELERAILQHDKSLDVAKRPRLLVEPLAAPLARGRSPLVALAIVLVLTAAAAATAFTLTRGGSSSVGRNADLASFVVKLENFLVQSRQGRREVATAIGGAARCKLGREAAIARLDGVQSNRQSLLQQVAALSVPARDEAVRASDLLQQAIFASISADWKYRDWLRHRRDCAPPDGDADLRAAHAADVQATRAKQSFASGRPASSSEQRFGYSDLFRATIDGGST